MVFAHDTASALAAAVELVNSTAAPAELATVADFDSFFRRHEYTGRHERTRAEVEAVLALRPRLRGLLTATRDTAVDGINAVLAEHRALPQLVRHGDYDWHIHAIGTDEPWASRIMVETAMAMIDVVRADELSRLALCADEDCEQLVLDLTRNRSKKYCSVTCGNRNAVAAYRSRQAETGSG